MEHVVALMLLVGCSADGKTCAEIPAPTPFYASIDECRSQLPLEMRMTATYDHKVLGTCAEVDEAMLEQSATVEWGVSRSGELTAHVSVEGAPSVADAARDGEMQLASR